MNRSSTGGIFLSIVLSLIMLVSIPDVYAQEITVRDITLEETVILELRNDSDKKVDTVRIWPGDSFSIESFKTEKGWIGKRDGQAVVFASPGSISQGESVKFGVKMDRPNSVINWQALDGSDAQIDTGIIGTILPIDSPEVIIDEPADSMSAESVFRIIPKNPNVGSTVRVTGDNFGGLQEFDFYIDTRNIGTFETDEDGHFVTTVKIPDDQSEGRVDFIVKDIEGKEKKLSLRVDAKASRVALKDIRLSIQGIPDVVNTGDSLNISGTGRSNGAVTAEIHTPDGTVINSRTASIDSNGNWRLDEPIFVATDTPVGRYSAIITDGRDSKEIYWTVKSDKKINITPTSVKFERGETMRFNGTALPNVPLDLVLENILGKEIASDTINVDNSGVVNYEYPTTVDTPEGTYTLVASQGQYKEFAYAGLGQAPIIPVNLEFDKRNYRQGETATITLIGEALEVISLLVLDDNDNPKGGEVSITLKQDGRATHTISLAGFTTGVYTAVISKGNTHSTEIFTVGFQTGSGSIDIQTTKTEYNPGDPILILGTTGTKENEEINVFMTITMIDPDGNRIKTKEVYSDKSGNVSESSFRVPSDAKTGTWKINARNDNTSDTVMIEVVTSATEGMTITVEKGDDANTLRIKVFGATTKPIIRILSDDGIQVGVLNGPITKDGISVQPWLIPKNTAPGIYTFNATNPTDTVETTFEIVP